MGEPVEKIYCCGDNSFPAWAMMGNNGGFGGGNMWDNPFAYLSS